MIYSSMPQAEAISHGRGLPSKGGRGRTIAWGAFQHLRSTTDRSIEIRAALNAHNASTPIPPAAAREAAAVGAAAIPQAFSQIVAVMRDPGYRNLRIADLEHLVLPR
jgi:hypothetical protein